jgi:hypothetical protein
VRGSNGAFTLSTNDSQLLNCSQILNSLLANPFGV